MKLNIGCGTDYREGFCNIDGSDALSRVDKVIDISSESLLDHFKAGEIDFILANDIVEHHFHWEAVRILKEFHTLLKVGAEVEIRVPDSEYIIKSWRLNVEQKLTLLFGGQDVPQGRDESMDRSRSLFPHFFCHKYGWTQERMANTLKEIGFSNVRTMRVGTNFVARAVK